ncbi:hypothetical protein HMPREF9442_03451 [Paraprevotella xylaniphila YIT 11841]|uniref:Uncharacterized protein n=1 Tax=Paraprevotella xylaniphila YIT 11841 TaxID=762982 RepID=F3QZ05_9BACT|nr:hypothetical protein HMPREF9442_03451 [Paraprevotella xylaniphila YIT 11841]
MAAPIGHKEKFSGKTFAWLFIFSNFALIQIQKVRVRLCSTQGENIR